MEFRRVHLRSAREAIKKRIEEEKKKQEREQKEKEEQERKRLAEEKAKQVAPAHGPLNVTFIDESPLAGKVSGDIVVGKASDESKIDSYILDRKSTRLNSSHVAISY